MPWSGAGFQEVHLAAQVFLRLVIFDDQDGFEGFQHPLARSGRGDGLEVGGADAENVDHNRVGAREEIGGEDVDLLRCERAADFLQKQRPVAGGEDQFGVTLVGVVDPLDAERARSGLLLLCLQEMPDGPDLGDDLRRLAEMERGGGHLVEMALHVRMVILAHDAEDFVAQRDAVGIELERVFFPPALEELAGRRVELQHQAFLPAVPAIR